MRLSSYLVWPLTACALAASGFYGYRRWERQRSEQRIPYETVKVDRGPIVAKVTASGTLSALVTVQVGSQVSGRLAEIKADFNTVVHKGEVIARIDPRLFIAALDQARANALAGESDVRAAKVQARNAELQRSREKTLRDRNLVAQADFDTAEANADYAQAQVASAEGRLAQAKAALHQAEVNLAYTTIESPIDGIVISRNVDVGQTVAASLQAPILFTIAEDLRKMQVDTSVAEADVGKLQPDMVASFTVDAYPTETFEGRVRQIRNAATTVQNVVTYDAVIDVSNPQLKLRPGMTANVTFVHASRSQALRVANAALRFKPPPELLPAAARGGGLFTSTHRTRSREAIDHRTLWVLRERKAVAVPIKIGITDGSHTEVLEGDLREGDEAITDLASTGSTPSPAPARRGMSYRRIL